MQTTSKEFDCSDCSKKFVFNEKEQNYFKENNWDDPTRCYPCRQVHKSLKPLGITCNMCKKEFMFSVKSQKDYTKKHWKYPVRCRPCHEGYKKDHPVVSETPSVETPTVAE